MVDWVNGVVPDHQIINFTSDWFDGLVLCSLVDSFAQGNIPDEETLEDTPPINRVILSMELAEMELGVNSIIRPDQFISKDAEQILRMAYITQFIHLKPKTPVYSPIQVENDISWQSIPDHDDFLDSDSKEVLVGPTDEPTSIVSDFGVQNDKIESDTFGSPTPLSEDRESLENIKYELQVQKRQRDREREERDKEIEKELELERARRGRRKNELDELFAAFELDFDIALKEIDELGTNAPIDTPTTKQKFDKPKAPVKETVTLNPSTAQKEEINLEFEFNSDTITSSEIDSRPPSVSPETFVVEMTEDNRMEEEEDESEEEGKEEQEKGYEEEKEYEEEEEEDDIPEEDLKDEEEKKEKEEEELEEKTEEKIEEEDGEDEEKGRKEEQFEKEEKKHEIVSNEDLELVKEMMQSENLVLEDEQQPLMRIVEEEEETEDILSKGKEDKVTEEFSVLKEAAVLESNIPLSHISPTSTPEPISEHNTPPPSLSPSGSPMPPPINERETIVESRAVSSKSTSPKCLPHRCKVSGRGLYYGVVNHSSSFTVDCSQAGRGRLEVIIEAPNGENLEADGEQLRDSVFRVKFVPVELGAHKIVVLFHEQDVPNSPFSCEVSDPSSCIAMGEGLRTCSVGEEVEFEIDATKAGPGTLQATFDGTAQPIDFQLVSCVERVFRYRYLVSQAGEYTIDLKWVGIQIPGSPFKVTAKEVFPQPTACVILERPLGNVKVREETVVKVDCSSAGKGELRALLITPKFEMLCHIIEEDDIYTVTTRPTDVGNHCLVLQFAGEPIPDSPILFHVNDPAQVKLDINPSSPQTTPMNKIFKLYANTESCGEGHMTAKATSPEAPTRQIDLDVEQDTNGRGYTINYIPSIPGMHNIHLYYDNKPCLSSPINLKVLDLDSLHDIVLTKSLPTKGTQYLMNKTLKFKLTAPNRNLSDFEFTALGIHTGSHPKLAILPTSKDNYTLEFRAAKQDDYKISVTYKDEHIQGSPFTIPVRSQARANKVSMYDPVIPLTGDKPLELVFDTSQAGHGAISASVVNSKRKSLPVYVEQVTDDMFRVAFIPKSSNTFMVSVFFADKHIGGSPFRVLYQEQTKDPPVAINFEPDMNIKGLMGAAVYGRNSGRQEATVVQFERGKYQISFQPLAPDTFDVHIYWFDQEIEGSPFEIDLLGMENESSESLVDSVPITVGEKTGILAATAVGRVTGPMPIKLIPFEDCLCTIEFTSRVKDTYDMNIFWNGKCLPGMPIVLPID